ncbi:hypothetical protein CUZ56_01793 [Saezia sanguinis]|uniref:Lipoprotein YbaY n=2 Tax=Saezia sanguinis TaxID=1965230 RepID=A0A433SCP1_9BURK|nr:hypothetical protein CUZ56_01793 [Saezia sanguinis]
MMKKLLGLFFVALFMSACGTMSQNSTLSGEVYYNDRSALPMGATLTVTLMDESDNRDVSTALSHASYEIKHQVPLPFVLSYDSTKLRAGNTYVLDAKIEYQGKLLYATRERAKVNLDGGSKTGIRVEVVKVY